MKRYFLSLLSLLLFVVLPASGQQTESMRVNADRVNMRKAASVDSGIVRALTRGTVVTVVSRDANWVKVQVPGTTTTGWVRSDLLVAVPASASGSSVQSATPASQPTRDVVAPPPPPPQTPSRTPPTPSRVAAPSSPKAPSGPSDASYRGGLTLFGGITSFTGTVTPPPAEKYMSASGFMAGIGVIGHLGGPIGIEIDAAYVQKGLSFDYFGKIIEHDNYGQASILLRPAFGSGPVRVFVVGGGEVGYAITCAYAGAYTGTTKCKVDPDEVSRVDYGLVVGGGVSFGPLAVQLRYDMGIANLSKEDGVKAKNKGLMILGSLIL